MDNPIVIIGAGVSGLRIASLLHSQGIECKVLEARNRVGGRVLSKGIEGRLDLGKFDLGPTWFWPQREPRITSLVNELTCKTFDQHLKGAVLFEHNANEPIQRHMLPEGAAEKSLRLVGGIETLVEAIAGTLPLDMVELNTQVSAVYQDENGCMSVQVEQAEGVQSITLAKLVILAVPPRMIARHIAFTPQLSSSLMKSLIEQPTWMAGQAKAIAIYERPFWRDDGLSGQAMSRRGPMQEIHDASPESGSGALFGFFGLSAEIRTELGEKKILELVVDQLTRIYGANAGKPVSLLYKDWSSDTHTAVIEDSKPLTEFPNYGPIVGSTKTEWGNKIIFAGTETASHQGGHLEGALQ